MKPPRAAVLALSATGLAATRMIVAARGGRVTWWVAERQLALPAWHPADRSLVNTAEHLIRSA
jgi:hypothetical protein